MHKEKFYIVDSVALSPAVAGYVIFKLPITFLHSNKFFKYFQVDKWPLITATGTMRNKKDHLLAIMFVHKKKKLKLIFFS